MVTDALRAVVAQRANGRCEYCLIDEQDTGFPHQVDHIVSRKHGGPSTLENLALACIVPTKNLIRPENTRIEAMLSEVDVALHLGL